MAARRSDNDLDLSQLNLDHIELAEDEPPSPLWRWFSVALWAGLAGLAIWFPRSPYFHALGGGNALTFVLSIAGLLIGVLLGRAVWLWMQEAAQRRASPSALAEAESEAPASALRRGVFLVLVIAGILVLVFGIPECSGGQAGATFDLFWFVVALGGGVVGILLVRFLFMQASRPPAARAPRTEIKLPPYFRWITLAVLIAGGGVALLGSSVWGESGSTRFLLSGVGFAVGVLAAIWLARRVEEGESKLKRRERRR